MMSRALFVAACIAMTAGKSFNLECTDASMSCGGKCCGAGWSLSGTDGSYTCTKDSKSCGLCGQDGIKACDFTAKNSGSPYAKLLDADKNEVPVTTSTPGVIGSAGGSDLAPTTPSAGVTLTLGTFNGMEGWLDIPASRFYGFTDFLLGLTATVPSFYTERGFTVVYSCDSASIGQVPEDFVGCDIFFFIYKCPPCERLNGGVAAQLTAMESPRWYAGNCGPYFKLNKDLGADHQFSVWQAEIGDGDEVSVELSSPAEFMFWAMIGKSVICSEMTNQGTCGESGPCVWLSEEGVCRPRGCPPPSMYQGPSVPRCQVCVSDEEDFIPEVVPETPSPGADLN